MDNLSPVLHPVIIGTISFLFGRYDFFNIGAYAGGTFGIPLACAIGAGIASLVMESGLWQSGFSGAISGNTKSILMVGGSALVFALIYGVITQNPVSLGTAVAGGVGAFVGSGGFHVLRSKLSM